MQPQLCLILVLTIISLGKCQFVTHAPSIFQNIKLGEPPSGVYIPQDSFLNVLRNPSYRNSWTLNPQVNSASSPSNINYNWAGNSVNNAPQQNLFVQPQPTAVEPKPNTDIPSGINDQVIENNQEQMPRKRTIRIRERISRQQNGNPKIYSPSEFENIGYGEVPKGVYVPPDSLLNVLRKPSYERNTVQVPQRVSTTNNFGLLGNNGNTGGQQQQFYAQPPMEQAPVARAPILSEVQYDSSPPVSIDEEEYGRKLTSGNRRRQSTQGRRMPHIRPSSIDLDPSMEYPVGNSREEMKPLLRSNIEYSDFEESPQVQRDSEGASKPRRRIHRRRKQTGKKPDSIEPVYPPRTYSPSVFQNIGLGEPPRGVHIPEDSMLNILKDDRPHRAPVRRTETMPSPAIVEMDVIEEVMNVPEDDSEQYSQTAVERKRPRQRSRPIDPPDLETSPEFGTRTRKRDPVLTFRESSQQRRRSHRRDSDDDLN